MIFEWDNAKEAINKEKHQVDFTTAKEAFFDMQRITTIDEEHSTTEETRYFCFGKVNNKIVSVRFVLRNGRIRIIGAGYWRKGRKFYEEHNKL
jgi:uncharacterized DUF497 family protein